VVVKQIEKWDYFEFQANDSSVNNPFLEVTLSAVFSHKDSEVQVVGFYDGEGQYKIRFMPDREGRWSFVTHSNVPGLDSLTGELLCTTPSANNHGPVRVARQVHFAYEDGTPYIPVGTTCYVWNLQGDELEERTLSTLAQSPFNKMRMCVFPKRYSFNMNEPPCYPFPGQVTRHWDPSMLFSDQPVDPPDDWDLSRFNPVYFQHLEKRILELRKLGIEADLILFHPYDSGAWGFDRLPREVNERYLRYLVARLAAFRNLWWSFANEYDLFARRTMEDWDHYMQLVQREDSYHHLRSIHNCGSFYDHTKPWVTHCSIQNGNLARVPAWRIKYEKPVVVDECGYEGNIAMSWGDLSPEEMVYRCWIGFTLGGYVGHGETYLNPEEVLWWSKGGVMHGASPARIAFLRSIFEQAPELTPLQKVDLESMNLMGGGTRKLFAEMLTGSDPIAATGFNCEACGFNTEKRYYLYYYGMHQPIQQNFNLGDGIFKVELIDTWKMTIKTAARQASGRIAITMPGRKYMALRIQRDPKKENV
jgi:hypothetical protein